MAQEVATIKIFPEEQIQVIGFAAVTAATLPMFGVARIGDKKPTGYRAGIVPANRFPNRAPRIPCQFIVIGFDANGNKVSGNDVIDGFIYHNAKLPNGKYAKIQWSAAMKNGKWSGAAGSSWGDSRNPQSYIEEHTSAGAGATQWLKFAIDDTGLLISGIDAMLTIPANAEIGDTKVKFTAEFETDSSCDGLVNAAYSELSGGMVSNSKSATIKGVITQPDWAVEKYTPHGWDLL